LYLAMGRPSNRMWKIAANYTFFLAFSPLKF
jgi:hypothetical protein